MAPKSSKPTNLKSEMASKSSKVSLKLLVDTKGNRVIFAEAGKDFVDFLFNVPSLPLGTVIKLLTKESMAGCLRNIYESIENLSENDMLQNLDKNTLLEPKIPNYVTNNAQLLFPNTFSLESNRSYRSMNYCRHCMASDPDAICACGRAMNMLGGVIVESKGKMAASASGEGGGYVKGVVKYMVMDDLVVKPMSTTTIMTLLNNFNITDLGDLKERVIDFGMDEAIKLLKFSLQSNEVLSTIFLREDKCIPCWIV